MARIWDLPEELLSNIAASLPPKDFLGLCSTCHFFYDNKDIQNSAPYWRNLLSGTFRVPNLPVAASDGKRWRSLYRRMVDQTHVMFWGRNDGGAGGLSADGRVVHLPTEVQQLGRSGSGVIADLQCGGWSTSILTSEGEIYFNGTLGHGVNIPVGATMKLGFGPDVDTSRPSYKIRQFSQGRISVLGLSDDNQIWSWTSGYPAASGVQFGQHEDTKALKVVAGWQRDSALLEERGLFIWNTLPSAERDKPSISVLVDQFWTIPTAKSLVPAEHLGKQRSSDPRHDEVIVNWVVLSEWIVWLTMTGRVFAAKLVQSYDDPLQPIELTRRDSEYMVDPSKSIVDIQGSHLSFGLFLHNGEVLIGERNFLEDSAAGKASATLRKIPSLQNTGVIQLAFGDWHFHALHVDGSISSYGREPQYCGALGLGAGRIRGLKTIQSAGAWHPDGELLAQCQTHGRRIAFEPEKQAWLEHLRRDAGRAVDRQQMMADDEVCAQVSEWVEMRLRAWDAAPPLPSHSDVEIESHSESHQHSDSHTAATDDNGNDGANANAEAVYEDDDGLPAYFPVSVVAGGWHSAALVLRNGDKAARAARRFKRASAPPVTPSSASAPSSAHLADTSANTGVNAAREIFSRARALVSSAARDFLGVGLPVRAGPGGSSGGSGGGGGREWAWAFRDEAFPRLRLRDGTVMPGDDGRERVEEWRAPEWRAVERVSL